MGTVAIAARLGGESIETWFCIISVTVIAKALTGLSPNMNAKQKPIIFLFITF
ncbi:hypothetical protein PDY_32340 [Photobacterium damselae subsp. damselae]|nr:hypothetical protein PDY_32340 [Photobacterium damselae subsp. damselae]